MPSDVSANCLCNPFPPHPAHIHRRWASPTYAPPSRHTHSHTRTDIWGAGDRVSHLCEPPPHVQVDDEIADLFLSESPVSPEVLHAAVRRATLALKFQVRLRYL